MKEMSLHKNGSVYVSTMKILYDLNTLKSYTCENKTEKGETVGWSGFRIGLERKV